MMKINNMTQKMSAEFIGTMFFIFLGCGTAIFAKSLGALGVPLAFGFAYAVSHYITESVSGGHLNPAISFALFLSKKIDLKTFLSYTGAQLAGALLAAYACYILMMDMPDMGMYNSNFIGSSMLSSGFVEVMFTAFLALTFMSATSIKGSCACNSLILGLAITAGTFLAMPFTNASLNPARSFGAALMERGQALNQLWFFFVMPMIGSILAMILNRILDNK